MADEVLPKINYAELEAAYEACIEGEQKPNLWIKDGYVYVRRLDGSIVRRRVDDRA